MKTAANKGKKDESSTDPRAWVRYSFPRRGYCGPLAEGLVPQWSAEVQDLSAGGIGLLVRRPFRVGALVVIQLEDEREEWGGFWLAKVVRAQTRVPDGWYIGCTSARRLDEEELRELLANPA